MISLNNTLGYESLSRGNKTVFFNLNDRKIPCRSYKMYGWPKKFKSNGPFWTNKYNEEKIYSKLNSILKMNKKNWKTNQKNFEVIKYSNNSILKNKIREIII